MRQRRYLNGVIFQNNAVHMGDLKNSFKWEILLTNMQRFVNLRKYHLFNRELKSRFPKN